jgi:NhaP-type Na+/H+ or K+/H+ antiporter
MITASLFTALMLYALAPASWSFWVCWMIGVIASATDPVAVVALLKELGASKALGTLIEGESLLNDGSAVVLFVWVRNVIGYDYATLAPEWMRGESGERHTLGEGQIGLELLRIIAQMLILGIMIGWVFGYATKWVLKFVYNDRFVESSFIIGMSYFAFWLSELVMGSSAVLAVVVMGLYMNYHKSVVSPGVQHFLHEFYEMIAHVMNTVIFLIAGCKLGALILDSALHQLWDNSSTRAMILLMWPIILVARGGAILLFFPLVSRLGTKCTWKDAIVMWWGGLRGSVGLALGLTVHHMMYDKNMWGEGVSPALPPTDGRPPAQDSLDCRDQPLMVLALTIVCVVFTVVIQGVSMAPLMQLLSMTKTPDERNFMLQSAYRKLDGKTQEFRAELQAKDELDSVDWDSVDKHIVQPKNTVEILHPDKAAWLLVVNLERAYYHAQFENAVLSSEAFAVLEAFMANLAAHASIAKEEDLGKLYDRLFEASLINKAFHGGRGVNASTAYEIGLAYLAGQREVRHLLGSEEAHEASQHGGRATATAGRATATEAAAAAAAAGRGGGGGAAGGAGGARGGGAGGDGGGGGRGGSVADAETRASLRGVAMKRRSSVHGLELVAKEHVDNEEKIRQAMRDVQSRAPHAVAHFQTNWAKRLVLNHQERLISHMLHEGELLDLDALPLRQQIEHQLALLYTESLKDAMQDTVNEARRSITRRASRSNLHDDGSSKGSPGRSKTRKPARTGPESPLGSVAL